jgi:predicted RNA-binding Zn-ribbon protein involved in translation (DUF1610 family)
MLMNYPIPKRVAQVFKFNEFENHNEYEISGNVVCTCGCDAFAVSYFGKTNPLPLFPSILKETQDERTRVALFAVCKDCGKKICLFDSAFDGFTGYPNKTGFVLPADKLKEYRCRKCGDNNSIINIQYKSNGKDYENGEISDGNWTEFFTNILVTHKCRSCGKATILLKEKG